MRTAFLVCALAALGAGPSLAAAAPAPPAAQRILRTDIPGPEGLQMTEVRIVYAPGQVSQPHRHGAFVVAYVLKGAITSQVEGEPARTYRAGESWTEAPGSHHVLGRNASDTEPAELLVVFVAAKDAVLTTPDP